MKIITISREFGSGGRELGKRLADILGYAYYDREIISTIAENKKMDEGYVEKILEKGLLNNYPLKYGRTFSSASVMAQRNMTKILVEQQKIIKEIAANENCIIVGRSSNVILREYAPLNLFVYADMQSKIDRCLKYGNDKEILTEKELIKKIKQVDKGRARHQELLTDMKWGNKEGYDLCINTTDLEIKELAPVIAQYAKYRLGGN